MPDDSTAPYTKVEREKLVPAISLLIIIVAVVLSDFSYWRIEAAATLFFYAILVQMWTELGPDDFTLLGRDGGFLMFILTAIGAVVIGDTFRGAVSYFTGEILPIQFLALGVLLSRWYVNARKADKISLRTVLRYRDPFDRRLVIPPCAFAFFLPVFQRWIGLELVNFDSGRGFFLLIFLSIGFGLVLHLNETGQLEEMQSQIQSK
ncbi:hypothetical protein [Halorhabdus salina]|uniref:hypothetical protein n=1 Tax=Halorhabdus salina TaxID=2750670 RepID=UPI0015EEE52D|nr:hypothetical protein [Halorhabdus salina]